MVWVWRVAIMLKIEDTDVFTLSDLYEAIRTLEILLVQMIMVLTLNGLKPTMTKDYISQQELHQSLEALPSLRNMGQY